MLTLRLAIVGVMSAVRGKAVVWLGLVCSSFTVINMGWSKRSFLVPMGDTSKRSVVEGNCLAARTAFARRTCVHVMHVNLPDRAEATPEDLLTHPPDLGP